MYFYLSEAKGVHFAFISMSSRVEIKRIAVIKNVDIEISEHGAFLE
jgi:hypothetical protein